MEANPKKEKKKRAPRQRLRTDEQEIFTGDEVAKWFASTETAVRRRSEREATTLSDGQKIAKLGAGVTGYQIRKGARWYYRRDK